MSSSPAFRSRALWRRLVLNPLRTKELRATFRQRRFVIIYWVSLAIYSAVVLIAAHVQVSKEALSAGQPVGQVIFNWCVAAQLALMVFVLPAFAATAVTDERENQSFDLLVTTALTARDIVWGKFLACMGYAFLFLAATFPLVCVSVLYTGVRPGEIVFAYVVMVMLASLMVAVGLTTSTHGRNSRRATVVTYLVALACAGGLVLAAAWLRGAMPVSYSKSNLFGFYYDLVFHHGWTSTIWAGFVPLASWAIVLSLLLILSVNRLKPASANRSTNLRVLGIVFIAAFCTALVTHLQSLRAAGKPDELADQGLDAAILAGLILTAYAVAAACEEPRLSRRVQRQHRWASGLRIPLRLLLPGSGTGLAYVLLLAAALFALCFWVPTRGGLVSALNAAARQSLVHFRDALLWTVGLLAVMVWFYAALGRWLSTVFVGPIYTRTLVVFTIVMGNLLPVCLMALADQGGAETGQRPATLGGAQYTSAIPSLRSVWDMTGYEPLPETGFFHSSLVIEARGLRLPVGKLAFAMHLVLAAVLTVGGAWRQDRVIRPQLEVLNRPRTAVQLVPVSEHAA